MKKCLLNAKIPEFKHSLHKNQKTPVAKNIAITGVS